MTSSISHINSPSTKQITNRFTLPSRFDNIEKYNVWSDFIHLALQYKPLTLGQGFPDFAPPSYITETLKEIALSENSNLHQYTRVFGHPKLVAALGKLYSKLLNRSINHNKEVFITPGALAALYAIISGNVDVGDEVIIIEPFFEVYQNMVKMSGGKIRYIPLKLNQTYDSSNCAVSSSEYGLDREKLASLFNSKTKAIIFNNPNYPLGKVYSLEEISFIADLCKKWNVLCISDEVYEWLVYPPYYHTRIATISDMWERTVTIGSAGKTFSVTGWKIGWIIGPDYLLHNARSVCDSMVNSCNVPLQETIATALEMETDRMDDRINCYFYSLGKEMVNRRDYLVKTFEDVGMKVIVPQGGYFIMVDFLNWESHVDLSKETDEYKDSRFCKWMTKNVGLMGMPSTAFYNNHHKSISEHFVRYCFVKDQRYLEKVANVLRNYYQKIIK